VASLQTQDCVLLLSEDVDLWSNSVDWRLTQIKLLQSAHLCWRDTMLMRPWEWHGVLATHKAPPPAAAIVIFVGLNRKDMSGQKYRTNNAALCNVCWTAFLDGGTLSPTGRLAASSDRLCDNYYRVNWMWAVEQCTREMCVRVWYRTISGHCSNHKVTHSVISQYRLIDMNPIGYALQIFNVPLKGVCAEKWEPLYHSNNYDSHQFSLISRLIQHLGIVFTYVE